MLLLEQACGKQCATMQPLSSIKQGHSAQSEAPVAPLSTLNQVQDAYAMVAGILLCLLGSGACNLTCDSLCGCSTRARDCCQT